MARNNQKKRGSVNPAEGEEVALNGATGKTGGGGIPINPSASLEAAAFVKNGPNKKKRGTSSDEGTIGNA